MKLPTPESVSEKLRKLLARDNDLAEEEKKLKVEAYDLLAQWQAGADANKGERIEALITGNVPQDATPARAKYEQVQQRRSDIDEARFQLARLISTERHKACIEICHGLKADHNRMLKELAKALCDVHRLHTDFYAMDRALINGGIGHRGIFHTTPDFMGRPNDRGSELGVFLREAAGLVGSPVPKEFK